MKMRYYLFYVFVFITFMSCTKDKECEDRADFTLYQTVWKGQLIENSNSEKKSYDINLVFETDRTGRYFIDIEQVNPKPEFSPASSFRYTLRNDVLDISAGDILNGSWMIFEKDKNKLIIKRDYLDDNNNSELNILRIK